MRAIVRIILLAVALSFSGPSLAIQFTGVQSSFCNQVGNGDFYCSANESLTVMGGDPYFYTGLKYSLSTALNAECFDIIGLSDAVTIAGNAGNVATFYVFRNAGTTAPGVATCNSPQMIDQVKVAYMCTNGMRVVDPGTCGTNQCPANIKASLEVDVSSANPPSIEYSQVCLNNCRYGISQAQIGQVKDTGQFVMYGTWISAGSSCEAENPTGASVDPSDPSGPSVPVDQGGGETPDLGVFKDPGDACADNDVTCIKGTVQTRLESMSGLTDGEGNFSSVIGNPLQFPSFPWTIDQGERVCKLDFDLGEHLVSLRSVFGEKIEINFCGHLSMIDRIGGFIVYVLTALAIWSLFMRTPGAA